MWRNSNLQNYVLSWIWRMSTLLSIWYNYMLLARFKLLFLKKISTLFIRLQSIINVFHMKDWIIRLVPELMLLGPTRFWIKFPSSGMPCGGFWGLTPYAERQLDPCEQLSKCFCNLAAIARMYTYMNIYIFVKNNSAVCVFHSSLVARALIENPNLIRWSLLLKAFSGLLALLCGNGYIVGINQIYDVGIDK